MANDTKKRRRRRSKDAMIVSGQKTQKRGKVKKIVPEFRGLIKERKRRMEGITN